MSLNKYMHNRNPFYNNPPDFSKLAKLYPEFEKHCIISNGKCEIDFKNNESLKCLTCILLKDQFNLNVDLPLNHLIPRVPQRINYVLWIEDLIQRNPEAKGIDIGCGASCIYALIACSLNKNWNMLVSDISQENIEWSTKNVNENKLNDRIKIVKVNENSLLLDLLEKEEKNKIFDFVMCNPPFFSNESEAIGKPEFIRNPNKRHSASSANVAQSHEMIFEHGGEVGFVKKMIDESIIIGKRIKIYTTMLGKKRSLVELKDYLIKHKNILNISESQFCQGHTMRWGLAWSFEETKLLQFDYMKLSESETKQDTKKLKPISFEFPKFYLEKNGHDTKNIYEKIRGIFINNLGFKLVKETNKDLKSEFNVYENTWSRQRAKRRKQINLKIEISMNDEKSNDSNISENELESNIQQEASISLESERIAKEPIVKFSFQIKTNADKSKISIEINSPNIELSQTRLSLNEILQYVKNFMLH